jgi:hypothetical protein
VTKISQLSSIGDSLAVDDQFLIRDIDDTVTPNKSVTISGMTRALDTGTEPAPALAFASDKNTGIYSPGADTLAFVEGGVEVMRIDNSGRLLVGTPTASGAAIFQVQTPTTLSTRGDDGVHFANTSTKTYPTTSGFVVAAGINQQLELGTAQTIDTVTPGGFNFVYGFHNVLTKSAGNTQDIERLYFNGIVNQFSWADANTCKQYVGITDTFNYRGQDANGRISSSFNVDTIFCLPPSGATQTISLANAEVITFLGENGTVNITNGYGKNVFLNFLATDSGVPTAVNITSYASFRNRLQLAGSGIVNATITDLYGLWLTPFSSPSVSGLTITNNWGVYQEWSSAKNWFAAESNQLPNITTTASAANAFLDSADSNRLYRSTSSSVYKKNIENLEATVADKILDLRPVWYRSKCQNDRKDWSWYGLIAEEVAEIDPRFVHYGYQEDAYEFIETTETVELRPDDPRREQGIETEEVTRQERQLKADAQQVPNGVAYERLVVPLLDIIKRQKSQLDSFETRLAALEAR